MVKKKIDPRVRTLIENGTALRQRTMFVLVGDRGRDQVVNLHYMLSKAMVSWSRDEQWILRRHTRRCRSSCAPHHLVFTAATNLVGPTLRAGGVPTRYRVFGGVWEGGFAGCLAPGSQPRGSV